MRLLTFDGNGQLFVTRDLADGIPPYAILSHTWGADEDEVTYHDLQSGNFKTKVGYKKIQFCAQQAKRDKLQHFWIDTCCIDKTNHVELSEAITSMYRWYSSAQICYVYLADVASCLNCPQATASDDGISDQREHPLRQSRWCTRGWTLQELLAPRDVVFYSKEGDCLGTKRQLKNLLHEVTRIPVTALDGRPLSMFSISERMHWAKDRMTQKKEDRAYCLLGIFNVFMYLNYGEGDNAFLRLNEAINQIPKALFSLQTASGAMFDSYGQMHQAGHPDTRVGLLQSVRDWAHNETGRSIFWLNGAAGTGKSTIAWTIARWLADLDAADSVALGGTFFFKRGESEQAMAVRLFPTLATQLAMNISHFDAALAQAVNADPQICSRSLAKQFHRLVFSPLQQLGSDARHKTYVLVIDALDECSSEADIRTVLQLCSRLRSVTTARIRLFISSRPELEIRLGFKKMSADIHQDMALHEISQLITKQDILAFLSDALADVRDDYNLALDDDLADERLSANWPGGAILNTLADMAMPLFTVAATIRRLMCDADQPQQMPMMILNPQKSAALSDIGKVYMLVLKALVSSARDEREVSQIQQEFCTIIGAIVLLGEPVSRVTLASLLGLRPSHLQIRLRSLHAVLEIPSDGNAAIRPFHLSFGDYITSQEIHGTSYWVDAAATHTMLWQRCLQLLTGPAGLRENICRLTQPGKFISEVPLAQIDECIQQEIRYACRYWVYHAQASGYRIHDGDEIHLFLQSHFLHWLEVLSFMDQLANAVELTKKLQSMMVDEDSAHVAELLEDARQFIIAFQYIGNVAPLQLYSSAIVFAPQNSAIKRVCMHDQLPNWVWQGPNTASTWILELQKLDGCDDWIQAVTFSPSGMLIASTSSDQTIRLWSATTGQELQKFEGHTQDIVALAFSSDGLLLTSMSADLTIRVWDVSAGQEIYRLEHTSEMGPMPALSSDGSLCALMRSDDTVRLLDIRANRELLRIQADLVQSAVFSPDDSLLALMRDFDVVQVWDTSTGKELQTIEKHGDIVWEMRCVAFSPDFSLLALGSSSGIIQLYDMNTMQETLTLKGHQYSVLAVKFSPSGLLIASLSFERKLRLWDANTGDELRTVNGLVGHTGSLAFSPDSSILAYAALRGPVRLWITKATSLPGVKAEQCLQASKTLYDLILMLTFSPDSFLLASATGAGGWDLWDARTGQLIKRFSPFRDFVKVLAFSPDNTTVATAGNNLWLWDIKTAQTRELARPYKQQSFDSVSFSNDSSLLAAASHPMMDARTWPVVRLWNVKTGQMTQKFETAMNIYTLSFSPSNDTFFAGEERIPVNAANISPCSQPPLSSSRSSQQPSNAFIDHGLAVNSAWIECHGRRLLWLPEGYRSKVSAVRGDAIAIAQTEGTIAFLRIKCPFDSEHGVCVDET